MKRLPADLYASPPPRASAQVPSVTVYFTSAGRLQPVQRVTQDSSSTLEFALRALLSGPSSDEHIAGLDSAIPDSVELLAAHVSRSTGFVNVSKEFELGAEQPVLLLRLAQVVFTATALRGVSRVRFLVDGDSVNVVDERGVAATRPVGRGDYATLAPDVP